YTTMTRFVYGSTRADDSITATDPTATYYISATNKVVCTIAGAFFLYQLAQTPMPVCPTSVAISSTLQLPLTKAFPSGYRTGIGILTDMLAGPGPYLYN